jgi:hypothetical protein
VPLSEQQLVDCAHNFDNDFKYTNWGCGGGWPGEQWLYSEDHGMYTYENYPYTQMEQDCADYDDPDVEFKIKRYEYIGGFGYPTDAAEIAYWLQEGPLATAVDSECDAYYYYQSGVLRSEDCGSFVNISHAMVIAGLYGETGSHYKVPM